jgi:putative ATPase
VRRQLDLPQLEQSIQRRALLYDKGGEEHYNLISALHKSMRNSDPDAAVYWVARMLEAGEDPLYIARRLCGSRPKTSATPIRRRSCRRRRQGRDALHRHARRQHALAQAAIYLATARKQRGVHRVWRRRRRCPHTGGRPGSAASAECAHKTDEGSRTTARATSTRTASATPSPVWTVCRESLAGRKY